MKAQHRSSGREQVGTSARIAPSEQNLVSDMDVASLLFTPQRCLLRAPVTQGVRSPDGSVSLGAVMTLIDLGTSSPALIACRPDWTATQDMSLHGIAPVTAGPIVVDSRLLRVGNNAVVVSAEIYDGQGLDRFESLTAAIDRGSDDVRPAGRAITTFARLPRSSATGVDEYDPARWVGEVRRMHHDRPVTGNLYERMGLSVVDAERGTMTLTRTPYVVNSINTINGGAQAILAEAAADLISPGLVATDMEIRFLSQIKVGPARTVCRILRRSPARSVVCVDLLDHGDGDRMLALATVTLEAPR